MPDDKKDETPQYVTREELAAQGENLLSRIEGMLAGIRSTAAPTPTPQVTVDPDPPLDLDGIDEAVADGRKGAAEKIAALASRIADKRVKEALRDRVDPLQTLGVTSLTSLARDRALALVADAMGEKGKSYVKKYEKEIDAFMATMSDGVRSDIESWKKGANLILGQHMPEIMAAETEAAHRAGIDSRPDPSHAQVETPTDDDGTPLPTLEELAGPDGARALSEKGLRNLDDLAQKMGYKDGREYLRLARQIEKFNGDLL